MMIQRRLFAVFALCWLVTGSFPAIGQQSAQNADEAPAQEGPASPATSEGVQPPRPSDSGLPELQERRAIGALNLVSRAEQVMAELSRIEARFEPTDQALTTLETELPEVASAVNRLATRLQETDAEHTTLRMLKDLRAQWLRLDEQFALWMELLKNGYQKIQDERGVWRETHAQWILTRETALPEDFPAELMVRIDEITAAIEATQERLHRESDRVVDLIDRVAIQQRVISRSFDWLEEIDGQVRLRALVRNAAPLWALSPAPAEEEEAALPAEPIAETSSIESLVTYAQERPAPFLLHLMIFVAALLGVLLLRRHSRDWPADEHRLDTARTLVTLPVAVAIVVALMPARWIYDNPPAAVLDLALLLLVVPILRIGRHLLRPELRSVLYSVALLFVLDRTWRWAPDGSLLQRLLLLAVTLLGLGLALWLLLRPAEGSAGGWRRGVARAAAYLAAVLFAVSAVANIFGWSVLSQVLTGTVVNSAFLAVSLTLAVRSIAGLLDAVTGGGLRVSLQGKEEHRQRFKRALLLVVRTVAVLIWIRQTLLELRLWDPLEQRVGEELETTVSLGSLAIPLGNILTALLILLVTPFLSRVVRYALHEEILPRLGLSPAATETVSSLMNYAVIAIGVLIAAGVAGLNATQLTVVFGGLGVGIGFGLQTLVNNFVSGLILMFERPIAAGDLIETNQRMGYVTGIGLRASTIRTFDGADVIVPNGDLLANEVVNYTLSDRIRRATILLKVKHSSDVDEVLAVLSKVASENPLVLDTPAPNAHLLRFGDSALEFRLFAWTKVENFLRTSNQLHQELLAELEAQGIPLAVPRQDVRLRTLEDEPG